MKLQGTSDYIFSVILFIIGKASQGTSADGFELSLYHGSLSTDCSDILAPDHILTAGAHYQMCILLLYFYCPIYVIYMSS